MIIEPLKHLLYSRKFLLAVGALAFAALGGASSAELIELAKQLVLVVVGAIAVEDAAEKFGAAKSDVKPQ